MPATFHSTPLTEIILIKPNVFPDSRGFFKETYHKKGYQQNGIGVEFVQDNFSRSCKNTLRGMHFQSRQAQDKLVQCLHGAIFDVAVDIRRGSPTHGEWFGTELTEENHHQLFIPKGFAHGFCVLSEAADVLYKCSNFYAPEFDTGIRWDSASIDWPVTDPLLSEKDCALPALSEIDPHLLPTYKEEH